MIYSLLLLLLLVEHINNLKQIDLFQPLNSSNLIIQDQDFLEIKTCKLVMESETDANSGLRVFNKDKNTLLLGLLASTGSFVIKNSRVNILEITYSEEILLSAVKTSVQGLTYNRNLIIDNISQWKLIIYESYSTEPYGWSDDRISSCGGINMLGGYGKFAGMEVTKDFIQLPSHKHIRLVFNYHYIDAWNGENAFLRANVGRDSSMEYIWNDRYDFSKGTVDSNICGNVYPENRLSQVVDVTIRHSRNTLSIGVGSTLDQDPYENSFGISNLQIYIK